MCLWLFLATHLIADFSLQTADWAEKKTQKFRYLAGHALVYAIALATVLFLCIPGDVAWMPCVIIVFSHFFIDWIRVHVDEKYKTPAVQIIVFRKGNRLSEVLLENWSALSRSF